MDNEFQNQVKKLSNLINTKDLPKEEIERLAFLNVKAKEFSKNHQFVNKDEAKEAKSLYLRYLENYEFDNMSDFSTLGDLVVNEIQMKRIENSLLEFYNQNKDKGITYAPDKLLKAKQDLEKHIFDLKLKLGIDKEDQREDQLTALQTLQQRMKHYHEMHKHEFITDCSECGNILDLRRRVKDFDVCQSPWFAGRWLFNYEILKDVKDGKLSKKNAWRYMRCAGQGDKYKPSSTEEYCVDYIDHCLKHWNEIMKHFNNK